MVADEAYGRSSPEGVRRSAGHAAVGRPQEAVGAGAGPWLPSSSPPTEPSRASRSEERRVGKECRSRRSTYQLKKKIARVVRYAFLDFFFSSRRRHTRLTCDWSSDVCSSDLWWRTKRTVDQVRRGSAAPPDTLRSGGPRKPWGPGPARGYRRPPLRRNPAGLLDRKSVV